MSFYKRMVGTFFSSVVPGSESGKSCNKYMYMYITTTSNKVTDICCFNDVRTCTGTYYSIVLGNSSDQYFKKYMYLKETRTNDKIRLTTNEVKFSLMIKCEDICVIWVTQKHSLIFRIFTVWKIQLFLLLFAYIQTSYIYKDTPI